MRSVLVISLKTTMEKTRYDVRDVSDGRTYFVLVWSKILFVSLLGINTVCSYFVSFVFVYFCIL